LWDTLVVNYMIILLYSYIRPVFSKKIKRNHPETVEKPHTLLWTVSTLKDTSPDEPATVCEDYFRIW
jgi:hypothetical protein